MIKDVKIKVIDNKVTLPVYKTKGSAGADISARLDNAVGIYPNETALIPTGIFMEIPDGYEMQIRSRSGLAFKKQVFIMNSPATIDSDYRGEVKLIVANFGKEPFIVHDGDRLGQLVLKECVQANFVVSDELDDTERGNGGFGSTGVSNDK